VKIRFYISVGLDGVTYKDRVLAVADALKDGAAAFGDEVEFIHNGAFDKPAEDVDVACTWGVMGNSREIVEGYLAAGKRVLMFDKALIRRLGNERQGHFRVGMDGASPLKYMMRTIKNFERWERLRIEIQPRQDLERKASIVYCGSSQKYCDFYGLGDANDYAEKVFKDIQEHVRKSHFVYRPKPSWQGARMIEGTRFSGADENLIRLLKSALVLVTHGSAASVEAIISGVPVISLGPSPAWPVANHALEDIRNLFFASDNARFQWASSVAWCQWTADELRSGEAWQFLKGELEATR
jgi:predicted small metal-binding protein